MSILSNFYISIGVLVVVLFILQSESDSLMKKLLLLLGLALLLLWFDKPELFSAVRVRIGF
jgi:hypothetical protein